LQVPDTNGEIEALFDDIHEPIGQIQLHTDIRVFRQEPSYQRREGAVTERNG
jgi:hypothetical protein